MVGKPAKEQVRLDVPVGKVRFYDAEKGFGFLTKDEGGDVYVRANALPPGVTSLRAGQRVEFGVVEGRKGEQALSVHIVEVPPSLSEGASQAAGADDGDRRGLDQDARRNRQRLSSRPPPRRQDRQQDRHGVASGG